MACRLHPHTVITVCSAAQISSTADVSLSKTLFAPSDCGLTGELPGVTGFNCKSVKYLKPRFQTHFYQPGLIIFVCYYNTFCSAQYIISVSTQQCARVQQSHCTTQCQARRINSNISSSFSFSMTDRQEKSIYLLPHRLNMHFNIVRNGGVHNPTVRHKSIY